MCVCQHHWIALAGSCLLRPTCIVFIIRKKCVNRSSTLASSCHGGTVYSVHMEISPRLGMIGWLSVLLIFARGNMHCFHGCLPNRSFEHRYQMSRYNLQK